MNINHYKKLKIRMLEKGVRQIDLVPVIGRKICYISSRLNGKEPWNTEEIQAIGTLLEIPREQWFDYFIDENGKEEKS